MWNINTNSNDNCNGNITTNTNTSSTPISLIRNNVKIEEPIINDDNNTSMNTNCNESNAGSDVGSVMDLEDFENSF